MSKQEKRKTTLLKFSHSYLIITSFVLLFLSFIINIFGLDAPTFFNFQKDSESLITNKIGCQHENGKDIFGGMLVYVKEGTTQAQLVDGYKSCSKEVFAAYVPQVGIQGQIISFFAPGNPNQVKHYLWIVKIILVGIFAALLTTFIIRVRDEFSLITASVVLSLLLISNWLVYMARNLYWVPTLLFLPFIFSFVTFPTFKERKKLKLFYAILGLLVFLKCLTGYEFVSNIILSSFAPVIYYEVRDASKIPLRLLFKHLLMVCLAGLAGFAVALALNLTQLSVYYGSLHKGWEALKVKINERKSGGPNDNVVGSLLVQSAAIQPKVFQFLDKFLHAQNLNPNSKFYYFRGYLFSIGTYGFLGLISLPILLNSPVDIILQSVFFSLLVFIVICFLWGTKKKLISSSKHLGILLATFWGLISSISWFIVSHPHMINHLHLDGIVFYIPYALLIYVVIGIFVDELLRKLLPGLRS